MALANDSAPTAAELDFTQLQNEDWERHWYEALERTHRAVPAEFCFDLPDGGDVKPWEAVERMAKALADARASNARMVAALREAIEFAEQDAQALTPAGEAMVARWEAALAQPAPASQEAPALDPSAFEPGTDEWMDAVGLPASQEAPASPAAECVTDGSRPAVPGRAGLGLRGLLPGAVAYHHAVPASPSPGLEGWDAGKYQRAEERLCDCGAAGSGEGHTDWCKWIGSEWEKKGRALDTASPSPGLRDFAQKTHADEEPVTISRASLYSAIMGGARLHTHDYEKALTITREAFASIDSLAAPASPSPGLRVCENCGSTEHIDDLTRQGFVSCCPERKFVPLCCPERKFVPLGKLRAAVIEDVLAEFEKRTKAIPVGHEIPSRGASTYNWRVCHLDEFREIARAALAQPPPHRRKPPPPLRRGCGTKSRTFKPTRGCAPP